MWFCADECLCTCPRMCKHTCILTYKYACIYISGCAFSCARVCASNSVCVFVWVFCTFVPLYGLSFFFHLSFYFRFFLIYITCLCVFAFCKECSCGNLFVFCVAGYYFVGYYIVHVVDVVKSVCLFYKGWSCGGSYIGFSVYFV